MSETASKVDRRAILLGVLCLAGGVTALTRMSTRVVAAVGANGPELDGERFALLEQVAETLIPTTDTPGAIASGVPEFVRMMLNDWASDETRAALLGVLDGIESKAWNKHGRGFLELPADRRLEVIRIVDEEAFARQDGAWRKFKGLVLVGYYHSEIGATQELRFELVPGAWRSCLPLVEVGRASAV